MKMFFKILFVATTLIVAALMIGRIHSRGSNLFEPFADTYVPESQQIETRLTKQGERVVMQAIAEIPASADRIWNIVKDHQNMVSNTPSVLKSELIENNDQQETMRMVFSVWLWERSTEIKALKKQTPEGYTKEWSQVSGTVKINNGKWDLKSISAGSTRVLYELEIDTDIPIPKWFEQGFVLDYLPKVLKRVRKDAEHNT